VIAPPPAAQDLGPWRIDLLLAIWPRIARAVDTMHGTGAGELRSDELKRAIDAAAAMGSLAFVHRDLARTLCVMASVENMHVDDWLRRTVYESQLPRRKPPAPADLQIRLRGLSCRRLVATMDPAADRFRVTIKNLRGDVASCESHDFINALEGAIKMAGARADRTEDE